MSAFFTPFNLFLIAFLVMLAIYWLFSFFILYHLIRFGVGTRPKQASLIYLVGSLLLFFFIVFTYVAIVFDIPPFLKMI